MQQNKEYCPPIHPITYGWICPSCGRACAPWVAFCDCQQNSWITYNTYTSNTIPSEKINLMSTVTTAQPIIKN